MNSLTGRFCQGLIRWRWLLLLAGVALAAASLAPARRLAFDRSIENMFAEDDPLLVPYGRLKRTFGGNELVMAVYRDPELLAADHRGIRRLAAISDRIERTPGVQETLSLDRVLIAPNGDADEVDARGYLPLDGRLAAAMIRLFEGYTHGSDRQTAAVVVMLQAESESPVSRETTLAQMRRVMEQLPDGRPPGMLAGEPVMVAEGFRAVEEDGRRLAVTVLIALAATIFLLFRSVRWALIPLAVVQATLLMTRAVLVVSGLSLSMVSSMLTAIVTVVGVATVVHLIVRFREGRQGGRSPAEALLYAGTLLAAPIFWACATDAVGFASLLTAGVGPVQDFGLMMAVGSMMVVIAVALLVPGLALLGRWDADPHRAWGEPLLDRQLGRMAAGAERRPVLIGIGALAATVVLAAGAVRLEVESDFTRNFRKGSSVVVAYEFVEQHLGGAGVWDVLVPAPEALDWEYLRRIAHLEDRLRREVRVPTSGADAEEAPGLTKVISLAEAVLSGSPTHPDLIPTRMLREAAVRRGIEMMRSRLPIFTAALHGEDPQQPGVYYLRIMLRARERQSAEQKRAMIEQVSRIVDEEFSRNIQPVLALRQVPAADTRAEVTGFFVLLTRLIDSMLRDQWRTFGVATAGIGLMMFVAMLADGLRRREAEEPPAIHRRRMLLAPVRCLLLAVIALVPNAMPIFVVMGLMGWLGLKINMGAAMIAAVSMGLSIDSSIHYLTAFRRARRQGLGVREALDAVQQSVGRAVVFSTLALIVGFASLIQSEFVPTIYFGALVSLSMLGGLAGNLVILPVLLRLLTWPGAD